MFLLLTYSAFVVSLALYATALGFAKRIITQVSETAVSKPNTATVDNEAPQTKAIHIVKAAFTDSVSIKQYNALRTQRTVSSERTANNAARIWLKNINNTIKNVKTATAIFSVAQKTLYILRKSRHDENASFTALFLGKRVSETHKIIITLYQTNTPLIFSRKDYFSCIRLRCTAHVHTDTL